MAHGAPVPRSASSGPAAGLLLSHLLALRGIDSVVVESRSRAYCEARQRAGLLEAGTAELLRASAWASGWTPKASSMAASTCSSPGSGTTWTSAT